jgi:hypothetical protein
VLNYETEWMTREDIVLSSYEASLELNRIKLAHGLMSAQEVEKAEQRTSQALRLLELLDQVDEGDAAKLEELRPQLERTNAIVARPWNDWELGLRLGQWNLVKQGYYLVSQGLAAFATMVRSGLSGRKSAGAGRAAGLSTGGD